MPDTLDELVASLRHLELLPADDLRALQARCTTADGGAAAEALIAELVRLGKLTDYQATVLRRGQARSLVLGKCIILDKLGAGGMGVVYKAEQRHMKRLVALKTLKPALVACKEAVGRFQREVQLMAKLDHPHIVAAYDADQDRGIHFLVMQYVDGTDLGRLVRQQGPLAFETALALIAQTAEGLAYAQQQGVIHRDIKPSNVLLDREGWVRITDFGLARLMSLSPAPVAATSLTGHAEMLGTFEFMAPEQAEDVHAADHRSDMYSLGCTLYFLLTGRAPYAGESSYQQLLAHVEQPVPSLHDTLPELPDAVDAVFRRMVAKAPEDRYQTIAELLGALRPWRCRAAADFAGGAVLVGHLGTPVENPPTRTATDDAAALQETVALAPPRPARTSTLSPPAHAARPRRRLAWGGGVVLLLIGATLSIWRIQSSADSWDEVYAAFQLQALQLDKTSYHVGDIVHLQYELVHGGPRALRIPRPAGTSGLSSHVIGFRRHAIERIPNDEPPEPSAAVSRQGGRIALERSPITTDARVAPGTRYPQAGTVDTQGLAPGRYRCVVEYLEALNDRRIKELDADLELLPCPRDPWRTVEEAAELRRFDAQQQPVAVLAFSPDGSRAASAICRNVQHQPNQPSTDEPFAIAIWDVWSGARLCSWRAHQAHVHHVAFSADGSRLVSAGKDGIGIWDARTGSELARFEIPETCVVQAILLPDGQHVLASFQHQRHVQVWRVDSRVVVRQLGSELAPAWTAAVSPDGRFALTGGPDGSVRLWELATWQEIRCFSDHKEEVAKVAFLSDGKRALSGGGKHQCPQHTERGSDHAIRLWNIETGEIVRRLVGHANCVTEICPAPDGNWAISYAYGERAALWDLDKGVRVREFPFDQAVAISRESHVLFSPRNSQFLSLWHMFHEPRVDPHPSQDIR